MAKRDIIALGGSLGSIAALKEVCGSLPQEFAAAVAIVVHISPSSENMLAEIFGQHSHIQVSTALDGQEVRHGNAYVAPADRHLLLIDGIVRLGTGPRENMARPALDPLFRSVGISYGPRAVGVVLTGMLNDGAAGLADLKRCGGITIVQNPVDAMAPDMPLGALMASDIDYRCPVSNMARVLSTLIGQEADPAPPVPPDVALEVQIALGRQIGSEEIAQIASPVPLSCPACGGVLSQIKSAPLRFRCQVGHSYTAETLAAETENATEEAIRLALRIVKERAVLTEKMADEARRSGRPAAAASHDHRASEARKYTEILQRALSVAKD